MTPTATQRRNVLEELPPPAEWQLKDADMALTVPQDATAASAQRYYDGDHWQGSAGWIGQRPPDNDPNAQVLLAQIQAGFIFENAIKAVVSRHVGGILGHEPRWSFTVRRDLADGEAPNTDETALITEAEAALTGDWWDVREPHRTLKDAIRTALLHGRAVLRLYVPQGLRQPDGTVRVQPQGDQTALSAALGLLYLDAPDPTQAAVVTLPDTKQEVGVFRYERKGQQWAELTYLDDQRNTVLRVIGEDGTDISATFPLGGQLLLHELTREAIITAGVIQQQRLINLATTMMGRAINMAGFRERVYLGAQPPGYWVDANGQRVDDQAKGVRFVPTAMPVGAGTTQFVTGLPIYDEAGNLTGYTNPSVNYGDPVDPANFIKVRDDARASVLHEVQQMHVAISGDATASGESRKQARSEYESDLRTSKGALDNAGRWTLLVVLYQAANLAGQSGRYDGLRAEFACRVDAGPLSADEERAITERHGEGLLSTETAMSDQGVEDTDAEMARIDRERQQAQQREDASLLRLSRGGQVVPGQPQPGNQPPGQQQAPAIPVGDPAALLRQQMGTQAG